MFNCHLESFDHYDKITIMKNAGSLAFLDFITQLRSNEKFRMFFNDVLAKCRFKAFFWEVKPLSRDTLSAPFECVLVDSPSLAGIKADASAFKVYFNATAAPVVTFPNLGNDALLIVPTPRGDTIHYSQIAQFVREAPAEQVNLLWRTVGDQLAQRVSSAPLWLSTCGLGVFWVHVRLDTYPKYYTHAPYRSFP